VLLSAQRRTVPELATLFDMSRATGRCCLRRFNADGPARLYDEPRRGRPRTLGPQGLEMVLRRLQDDPRHAGPGFVPAARGAPERQCPAGPVAGVGAAGGGPAWPCPSRWTRRKRANGGSLLKPLKINQLAQGSAECRLKLSLQRPATVLYHLQSDGTLEATYTWTGRIS
jgi:hypothetical protein